MAKYDWSKDRVEDAVKKSYCYMEVLRLLDVKTQGNNIETLKRKIKEYNIDISHFTFHSSVQVTPKNDVYYYLTENSNISSYKLKNKLINEGLKDYKCENPECGITDWHNKPITLQLHHINGNNHDNRLENLILLCPNCHSQTENYCGQKNKKEVHYCECGRIIKTKNAKHCLSCSSKKRKKVNITKEEFIDLLKTYKCNRLQISYKLGVSETTVRKLCKKFQLPIKSVDLKKLLL